MKDLAIKECHIITKIAEATAQGRSHVANSIPCQDRVYHKQGNGVNVIALADGAGSKPLSHLGAEAVTKTICNFLVDNFDMIYALDDSIIRTSLLETLHQELDRCASDNHCKRGDLASTMLFACIKNNELIWGHIGDGVIGQKRDDQLECISQPENFEYANVTVFVVSPNALEHFRIGKIEKTGDIGIVLMSDGSAESLYSKQNKVLAPAVDQMFSWLNQFTGNQVSSALENNLEKLVKMKTTDDCSISMLLSYSKQVRRYSELPKEELQMIFQSTNLSFIYRAAKVLDAINEQPNRGVESKLFTEHIPKKTLNRYLRVFRELGLIERV